MIIYFCDTYCDVNYKDVEKLGFKIILMPYSIDEKEYFPFSNDDNFNYHEFYNLLRNCKSLPSTSGLSIL